MSVLMSGGASDHLTTVANLVIPLQFYPITVCFGVKYKVGYATSRAILDGRDSGSGDHIEIHAVTPTTSGKVRPRMETNGSFTPSVDDAFDEDVGVRLIAEWRAKNDRRMYLAADQIGTTSTAGENAFSPNGINIIGVGGKTIAESGFDGHLQDFAIWQGLLLSSGDRIDLNSFWADTIDTRPMYSWRLSDRLAAYRGGQDLIDGGTSSFTFEADILSLTAKPPGAQVRQWMSPRSGVLQSRIIDEDRQYVSAFTGYSVARLASPLPSAGQAAGGSGQDIPLDGFGGWFEKGEESYPVDGFGGFANDQGAVTAVEAAFSLAATAGITFAGDILLDASLTLAATLGIVTAADVNLEAALSFLATTGLTFGGQATSEAAVIMAVSTGLVFTGDATTEAAFALNSIVTMAMVGDATVEGTLTLDTVPGISFDSDVSIEAALSLLATTGLTFGNQASTEAALSLLATTGLTFGSQASTEAAFALDSIMAMVATGDVTAEAALAFAVVSGITFSSEISVETAFALAVTTGIDFSATVVAEASLSLAAILALDVSAAAITEAAFDLAVVQGMQIIAQAVAEAGLSLDAIAGITVSGEEIVISIDVSPGRTIEVRLESRVIVVEEENRTILVTAENREIDVEDIT